jgi:hypothetical protein
VSELVQAMEKVWRECVSKPQPAYIICLPKFYEAYRWNVRSRMLVWLNEKKGRKSLRFNRRRLAHISKGNNR